MKCHEILGVNEKSTNKDIENAYSIKMNILTECQSELSDNAFDLKSEELLTAYNECLEWNNTSASERIRLKLIQKDTNHSTQVPLYDIGFCSACGSECEDECCLDGCGCEGCGTAVDVLLYIGIGIGVIAGIVALVSKIHESYEETKAEEDRRNRQMAYNQAVTENQALEKEQQSINEKLELEKKELNRLEQQVGEVVSFAKLFEALGSNKTTQIQQIITNKLDDKIHLVSELQRREAEVQHKINENNMIIRRGSN